MARASRSPRQPLTVRLPFDDYREAIVRARRRNWSLSDYVAFCVRRELARGNQTRNVGALSEWPTEADVTEQMFEVDLSQDA